MTKKGRQKFWQMKCEKFSGKKAKFGKFSAESDKFSGIGGNMKQGVEMHHGLRGDGRPCMANMIMLIVRKPYVIEKTECNF